MSSSFLKDFFCLYIYMRKEEKKETKKKEAISGQIISEKKHRALHAHTVYLLHTSLQDAQCCPLCTNTLNKRTSDTLKNKIALIEIHSQEPRFMLLTDLRLFIGLFGPHTALEPHFGPNIEKKLLVHDTGPQIAVVIQCGTNGRVWLGNFDFYIFFFFKIFVHLYEFHIPTYT